MRDKLFFSTSVLISVALLYVLFLVSAPLFLDGNILRIYSPASVVSLENGDVLMVLRSRSAINIPEATLSYDLLCDNNRAYQYTSNTIHIEEGEYEIVIRENLAEEAGGLTCVFNGAISYNPHGPLTPRLNQFFHTEPIKVEENCDSSLD